MKVLVIGGGGREHAIAWRLREEAPEAKLFACPGNAGIARVAQCLPSGQSRVQDFVDATAVVKPDLVVVGPEGPLVGGLVDELRKKKIPVVGPTAGAARLEGSKIFAKDVMNRAGIPTARHVPVSSGAEGRARIAEFGLPVVIKADGLAAGKGVVIAQTEHEAEAALEAAGSAPLVIEEFLEGEEVSFIALTDGKTILPLEPTQDHKRVGDDDTGPNTGGMGAYCDSHILGPRATQEIIERVMEPAIATMATDGHPFQGFLYAGLMMTEDGPKVLEFNTRLGDPETQALMHRLDGGWLAALEAAATGNLAGKKLHWKRQPSVCVVMAAHGYPGSVRTGDAIHGIDEAGATGATVFHAGTKATPAALLTNGGRVLGITGSGATLQAAIENTYAAVSKIHFDGMHYRKDIGRRGLKRYNETIRGRSSVG